MAFPQLFHLSAAGFWGVQVTEFTEIGLLSLTHPFPLFPIDGHGTWSQNYWNVIQTSWCPWSKPQQNQELLHSLRGELLTGTSTWVSHSGANLSLSEQGVQFQMTND